MWKSVLVLTVLACIANAKILCTWCVVDGDPSDPNYLRQLNQFLSYQRHRIKNPLFWRRHTTLFGFPVSTGSISENSYDVQVKQILRVRKQQSTNFKFMVHFLTTEGGLCFASWVNGPTISMGYKQEIAYDCGESSLYPSPLLNVKNNAAATASAQHEPLKVVPVVDRTTKPAGQPIQGNIMAALVHPKEPTIPILPVIGPITPQIPIQKQKTPVQPQILAQPQLMQVVHPMQQQIPIKKQKDPVQPQILAQPQLMPVVHPMQRQTPIQKQQTHTQTIRPITPQIAIHQQRTPLLPQIQAQPQLMPVIHPMQQQIPIQKQRTQPQVLPDTQPIQHQISTKPQGLSVVQPIGHQALPVVHPTVQSSKIHTLIQPTPQNATLHQSNIGPATYPQKILLIGQPIHGKVGEGQAFLSTLSTVPQPLQQKILPAIPLVQHKKIPIHDISKIAHLIDKVVKYLYPTLLQRNTLPATYPGKLLLIAHPIQGKIITLAQPSQQKNLPAVPPVQNKKIPIHDTSKTPHLNSKIVKYHHGTPEATFAASQPILTNLPEIRPIQDQKLTSAHHHEQTRSVVSPSTPHTTREIIRPIFHGMIESSLHPDKKTKPAGLISQEKVPMTAH